MLCLSFITINFKSIKKPFMQSDKTKCTSGRPNQPNTQIWIHNNNVSSSTRATHKERVTRSFHSIKWNLLQKIHNSTSTSYPWVPFLRRLSLNETSSCFVVVNIVSFPQIRANFLPCHSLILPTTPLRKTFSNLQFFLPKENQVTLKDLIVSLGGARPPSLVSPSNSSICDFEEVSPNSKFSPLILPNDSHLVFYRHTPFLRDAPLPIDVPLCSQVNVLFRVVFPLS
jgi:hypothetical protein